MVGGDLTHNGAKLALAPRVRLILTPDPAVAGANPEAAIRQRFAAVAIRAPSTPQLLRELRDER
jgi:hypothetical protein